MHCTNCNGIMKKNVVREYLYDASGLPSVKLRGGVEKFSCIHCGHQMTSFRCLGKLHRALAVALAAKPTHLSPTEVRFLRDHLGMFNEDFARSLGVAPYQSSRWMSGPMGESAERALRLLVIGLELRADNLEVDLAALTHVAKDLRLRDGTESLQALFVGDDWTVVAKAA